MRVDRPWRFAAFPWAAAVEVPSVIHGDPYCSMVTVAPHCSMVTVNQPATDQLSAVGHRFAVAARVPTEPMAIALTMAVSSSFLHPRAAALAAEQASQAASAQEAVDPAAAAPAVTAPGAERRKERRRRVSSALEEASLVSSSLRPLVEDPVGAQASRLAQCARPRMEAVPWAGAA